MTDPAPDSARLLHRLLASALLEIREWGREAKQPAAFWLADLFHNIPGRLLAAAEGRGGYDEALLYLRDYARETKMTRWLDNAMANQAALDLYAAEQPPADPTPV